MTQSIKKCSEAPLGTSTCPVGHLRTADSIEQLFRYVDALHPIATDDGRQVMLLRNNGDYFLYDERLTKTGFWLNSSANRNNLLERIKLAPLAYRNGRPLHVGDKIIIRKSTLGWERIDVHLSDFKYLHTRQWSFADEVTS